MSSVFKAVLAAACVALTSRSAMLCSAGPRISVGSNVQVSASMPTTMHGEGLILADPTNAKRLLVCSMLRDPEMDEGVAVYLSEDSGERWRRTYESGHDDHAGDPACAFGPDGAAYLMMIPIGQRTAASLRLPLLRSHDGGHTWRVVDRTGYLDRESIVVDGTHGRFRGRVYAHGTSSVRSTDGLTRSGVAAYISTDGTSAFEPRVERASLGRRFVFGMGNSVVLSDGRWLALFGEIKNYWTAPDGGERAGWRTSALPEPENAWLEVVSSDDGGDSLNAPVTISGWHMPNDYVRFTGGSPVIAADATSGPFKDRLYVVWEDSRSGASDILLSDSVDRGETWSSPIVVNDNARNVPPDRATNQLMPTVAVNNTGVVAITWLDRRDDPQDLAWRERIAVSLDGGETFEPSVVVSEAPARFDGTEHWTTTASTVGGGTPLGGGGLLRLLIFMPFHVYTPGDYAGLTAVLDRQPHRMAPGVDRGGSRGIGTPLSFGRISPLHGRDLQSGISPSSLGPSLVETMGRRVRGDMRHVCIHHCCDFPRGTSHSASIDVACNSAHLRRPERPDQCGEEHIDAQ